MNLDRLKKCLNETYSRGQVGKHLPDMSPIMNGLNKEILYCHCFSILL